MDQTRCSGCSGIRDRIALGLSAYTALRLSGDSASQLAELEWRLAELERSLDAHRCQPETQAQTPTETPSGADTRGGR